jgi:hypothetical protein
MSMLGNAIYNLLATDYYSTSGRSSTQPITLSSTLTVEMSDRLCAIKELSVKGKNSNSAVLGSAEIKLSGTFSDGTNTAHNSGWLRALARMFNHLADNMDRLPTPDQTLAMMVTNKMS